jgi:hypothetical protein
MSSVAPCFLGGAMRMAQTSACCKQQLELWQRVRSLYVTGATLI